MLYNYSSTWTLRMFLLSVPASIPPSLPFLAFSSFQQRTGGVVFCTDGKPVVWRDIEVQQHAAVLVSRGTEMPETQDLYASDL